MKIAVVGAHLAGLPLNHQLLERGATLVRAAWTAPWYRLYALPNTTPPKPGLVRVAGGDVGPGVEVEVWDMEPAAFGSFVDGVPPPLCIGTIDLEDGEPVKGFLAESYAVAGAKDITCFGGWRNYLKSLSVRKEEEQ